MKLPKYKAWDKEQECWIKIASLNFDEDGELWYLTPVMDDFNSVYYENELGKTWELMQPTGEKDKNGTEVFTGHAFAKIFRTVEIPTGKSGIEKAIGIVTLHDGAFQVHIDGWGYELLSDVLKSQNTSEHSDYWENEVIGYICESPELLKES
ncbi:MAG: YopX family protein [Enterococcus sp.]|uniref:YopX family protein n=1 Tax=Enterococcus sp. TaxID=35783 RepID=UPI00264A1D6A|nr:YopX family protein [Enterococcus sp.]MDN6003570.1 YopX family protein [Enterococcus sp.]MDN6562327.1 YopX family protein [Enterococcus sp.]MDN6778115.1 YopX family protein [Enterococcus sp.]